ncbi:hypothetical protein Pfo_006969 [Paulownia fortunei]|nr:hypothetical protein Pfo_006969 [Paulownia fortunei]
MNLLLSNLQIEPMNGLLVETLLSQHPMIAPSENVLSNPPPQPSHKPSNPSPFASLLYLSEIDDILSSKKDFDTSDNQFYGKPSLYKGKLDMMYSMNETEAFTSPFKCTLVGKFSRGYPSMHVLRKKVCTENHSAGLIGIDGDLLDDIVDAHHDLI